MTSHNATQLCTNPNALAAMNSHIPRLHLASHHLQYLLCVAIYDLIVLHSWHYLALGLANLLIAHYIRTTVYYTNAL